MNRIILIGNGFDLAHGLHTSYKDFIDNYWVQYGGWLSSCLGKTVTDELCSISLKGDDGVCWYYVIPHYKINGQIPPTPREIIDEIKSRPDEFIIKKSPFFSKIDNHVETKTWVDIESEYYIQLKNIAKNSKRLYDDPNELDAEFEIIKSKLIAYLREVQKENIVPELEKECIRKSIFEPFNIDDIAIGGRETFNKYLINRLDNFWNESEEYIRTFLKRFGISYLSIKSDLEIYKKSVIEDVDPSSDLRDTFEPYFDVQKHIDNIYNKKLTVPDFFLLPDQILFLNFNYTKTANLYIPVESGFKINHIHGELDNEKNPVIFGYGDELDEDYKTLSNLNNNCFLKNIKSIRYLETDNYRQLLRFIDTDPYQIYIMGHSCGNSDRTLLNTLFEHRNCISIKPFYHQKPDGSDDYIEKIQNISRNFDNMQMMRDRVVNKTYCRPLMNPA